MTLGIVIMRIGADDDVYAHLTGLPAVHVVQIEAVKVGVYFQAGPGPDSLFHDLDEVELIRITIAEKAPRRMPDHSHIRILHRSNNAHGQRGAAIVTFAGLVQAEHVSAAPDPEASTFSASDSSTEEAAAFASMPAAFSR